jgi:hypothetical protein
VRWPQIRAGLIALAIAFGLIDGLPLPAPDATPAWEAGFVDVLRHAQHAVMWPVAWMHPVFRITQQWALYQAPGADSWRLWIEGRDTNGRWRILYRAGDPEHTEDAAMLEYLRIRGSWDASARPPPQFSAFADWMTLRVLDRHPMFTGARMRFEKVRLSPDGVTPLGEFAFIHIRDRGAPR